MTEPADLPEKVSELEAKVRKLEIAALIILNLIMVVYLLSR
jgi:hypothetical protein